MELEVFWGSGSPYAWRVLFALQLKGVPFTSRPLSFSAGEHKRPEFLQINPRHKVPAIREGDTVVTESIAILAWLDRRFPDPPLFGSDPRTAGQIWREVMELQQYVDPAAHHVVRACYFGWTDDRREELEARLATTREELERLDKRLRNRPWLRSDGPTAADCVFMPMLESLYRAASKEGSAALDFGFLELPGLLAYRDRFRTLPATRASWPAHWDPPPRPPVSLREVDKDTYLTLLQLKTTPDQDRFVANNAISLAQLHFNQDRAWARRVCAGEAPIGFVMMYDEPDGTTAYLWRFLIDRHHQGSGYGREAMQELVELVRSRGKQKLTLSYVPQEGHPGPFYEALGFQDTGRVEDGERILELEL